MTLTRSRRLRLGLGGATVLVLLALFGPAAARLLRPHAPPLPSYGRVPAFHLTDQTGRGVGEGDLRGRVWVADFIFTSCSGVCPVMTGRMSDIQRFLDGRVPASRARLVSFSVDPDRDTPAVLAGYGARHGVDPRRWSLLTGRLAEVESAAVAGFKLGLTRERPAAGEPPGDGPDGFAILHGSKLVLVDADLGIRGYYDADAPGVARLEADLAALVDGGGK